MQRSVVRLRVFLYIININISVLNVRFNVEHGRKLQEKNYTP